jgi:pentatricopeptide repeat protein
MVGPARGKAALIVAFVLATSLGSNAAWAQSDEDRATARAAATEGATAFQEGHFDKAIDLFTRAEGLVHAPPHLLYLARSYMKLGRLVHAHEVYVKMQREDLAANAPRAFVDAQAAGAEDMKALEARLPRVKVVVQGTTSDAATVTIDGTVLSAAAVGLPRPMDPGHHDFVAKAEGRKSGSFSLELKEGAQETVTLTLDREDTPEPAPGPAPAPAGEGSGTKTLAYVAWGVGAVGLVTGTIFLLSNRSNRDDADALCPNGACPASKRSDIQELDDSADRAATLAWISYGVGIAGIAAGTALFFLSGPRKAQATTASVRPWVGPRSVGLVGRF